MHGLERANIRIRVEETHFLQLLQLPRIRRRPRGDLARLRLCWRCHVRQQR